MSACKDLAMTCDVWRIGSCVRRRWKWGELWQNKVWNGRLATGKDEEGGIIFRVCVIRRSRRRLESMRVTRVMLREATASEGGLSEEA